MRSFALVTVAAAGAGLWISRVASASPEVTCASDNNCPSCSVCKDDLCVYDAFMNHTCKGIECKRAICTGLGACTYENLDYVACGNEDRCLHGVCGRLKGPFAESIFGRKSQLGGRASSTEDEESAWYALLESGDHDIQISARVTGSVPGSSPNAHHITSLAIKYEGGHTILIRNRHPYATKMGGCPADWFVPCLGNNSLQLIVDSEEIPPMPVDLLLLPGDSIMTAMNLPLQCHPYSGKASWVDSIITQAMMSRPYVGPRASNQYLGNASSSFIEWALQWAWSSASPAECGTFLVGFGVPGALLYQSNYTVLGIETPSIRMRIHHGFSQVRHEVNAHGREHPERESSWNMELHIERHNLDAERLSGILGEAMRTPQDTNPGNLLPVGATLEDYRIGSPFATDFNRYQVTKLVP